MVQKCALGLKPKRFGNEPVLICPCVCVCDFGMTSLADAYQCACLALFFLFVFGKREEQVCELCVCVWGKAQTDRQSHVVCLSLHLSRLSAFFFSFLFNSFTCFSNRPPVRPVLVCPLLCFIAAYLFGLSDRKISGVLFLAHIYIRKYNIFSSSFKC